MFMQTLLFPEDWVRIDSKLGFSKFLRLLVAVIVVITVVGVTVIAAFANPHLTAVTFPTSQSGQGSAAYAAAFWLWARGGENGVNVIVTNLGNHPVTLCLSDWSANGTELIHASCSKNPAGSGGQVWWRLSFQNVGYTGTIVVYSQDSATPIAPFGQVTIDQSSNKVVDTAVGLQWVPVSPP